MSRSRGRVSSDKLTTLKPAWATSSASRMGMSAIQGAHHVAQTCTSSTDSDRSPNPSVRPSSVAKETSARDRPTKSPRPSRSLSTGCGSPEIAGSVPNRTCNGPSRPSTRWSTTLPAKKSVLRVPSHSASPSRSVAAMRNASPAPGSSLTDMEAWLAELTAKTATGCDAVPLGTPASGTMPNTAGSCPRTSAGGKLHNAGCFGPKLLGAINGNFDDPY